MDAVGQGLHCSSILRRPDEGSRKQDNDGGTIWTLSPMSIL
jgi:hypothetical protein